MFNVLLKLCQTLNHHLLFLTAIENETEKHSLKNKYLAMNAWKE
jgi:hypothetical protein